LANIGQRQSTQAKAGITAKSTGQHRVSTRAARLQVLTVRRTFFNGFGANGRQRIPIACLFSSDQPDRVIPSPVTATVPDEDGFHAEQSFVGGIPIWSQLGD
jgi:hypothetical protein